MNLLVSFSERQSKHGCQIFKLSQTYHRTTSENRVKFLGFMEERLTESCGYCFEYLKQYLTLFSNKMRFLFDTNDLTEHFQVPKLVPRRVRVEYTS